MKLKIKILINKLLEFFDKIALKFGLSLIRVRNKRVDNISLVKGRSLIYKTSLKPVTSELELSRARILSYTLNTKNNAHVNLIALKQALATKSFEKRYQIIESILTEYSKFTKQNNSMLDDIFGTQNIQNKNLEEVPKWFITYPWSDNDDIKSVIQSSNFSTLFENVKRGGPHLNANDGGAQHYLTNKKRAVFETKLLYKLLKSIETKGYKPSSDYFDPIGAVLLIKSESEWCWMVSGGIHRSCVLSALNYYKVDVSVKKVIYREDVDSWPNVMRGYFNKEVALEVFDNVLYGNVNNEYKKWTQKYLNTSCD